MKTKRMRDLSLRQFAERLVANGMKGAYAGYVDVGHGLHVYRFNAGDRHRDQLRYLLDHQAEACGRASTTDETTTCALCADSRNEEAA